jgi:hypothetical protein
MLFVALLLVCGSSLHAYENFIENPLALYPPGCATLPDLQVGIYGDNYATFLNDTITLPNGIDLLSSVDVKIYGWRMACAESNRSVILIGFEIPSYLDPRETFYITPEAQMLINGEMYYMRLTGEPNTYGSATEPDGSAQMFGGPAEFGGGHGKRWMFVLDQLSIMAERFDSDQIIMPSQYNAAFTLRLAGLENYWDFSVPSTTSLLGHNFSIPLSGRHSGIWVSDGAADQGFLISISENPNDVLNLVLFISWYTFGPDGKPIWVVGNTTFEVGDSDLSVPANYVSSGRFLSSQSADRQALPNLYLSARSCNDLRLDFDLRDLGLTSGTLRLQRLGGLETGGFVCRDLEARLSE